MPASPAPSNDGPVRITLSIRGADQSVLPIISVSVHQALNRIPWAQIVLKDGDMPEGQAELSDGALFEPGADIVIKAGYGDDETPIFSGVVVRHGFKIHGHNDSRLIVECRHKASKLTLGRHSAVYLKQTDSAILQDLISQAGLSAQVESTSVNHAELVQYHCTDWDFLLARAEAMGMLISVGVADTKVCVAPPKVDGAAVLTLTWGSNLIDLRADMDARDQWTAVQACSWDPGQQGVLLSAQAKPVPLHQQGNLSGVTLARVASPAIHQLQSSAPQIKGALDAWAKGVQMRAGLARLRGQVRFQGSALAEPGKLIKLEGVGKRFNGDMYISAVRHEIRDGNWISEAEFGLDPNMHMTRPEVMAPPNGGLLPGVSGLQIGVVLALNDDPQGQHRIKVQLPALQTSPPGVWARLMQFHASGDLGSFFVPEVGDEVVIGFFNEDPSHPVVLGSLYSSKHNPPYALSAENNTKALVTRSKHKIEFDDKDKIITVTTPGTNKIVLDDKAKQILLSDQHGNQIKLSADGIELKTGKDLNLKASGKINLEATAGVQIKASGGDVKVAGMNVNCEAQVGVVAKGTATAELSASGQTTVKGAIVMIN